MSDLKLCWSLKIVLTFSAGLDAVTSGTSLLEFSTGQEQLCHWQVEVAMGDQPGVGKGARREKLLGCYWGHRVDVKPALTPSIA